MRASRTKEMYWATLNRPVKRRGCDFPGCAEAGDYRAPRSRDRLNEYYWFCQNHARQYNEQWDYLAGLSIEDIEKHIRSATVWDRPTWPLGEWQKREQELRDKVKRAFFSADGLGCENPEPDKGAHAPVGERDALTALDLQPPVTFAAIKKQYRRLVKRHHPDANGGSRAAEEKIKTINQAFTLLKMIYGTEEGGKV